MDDRVERIYVALKQFKRNMESELLQNIDADITGPQMFMLCSISQQEKCRLAQLADRMEVKPSAITVMIDRLEKPGYVKRVPDPSDRRSTLVEITPAGQEVLEKAIRKRNEILRSYLSRLQPEEVELFAELLEKLANHRNDASDGHQ
ncbi:MarR family winged helix-turn-helix transcriptional regulator [Paenibacillus thermoaerophilus]|uniref:MarR family winged helix-turn-helix transcriptional regulator n=1 Tax=Paenibacillus thermoaerophilus TaxID=1215385 RepID=A0ABW2V2C7_9BACL|nr:MarR family transcriptional regulator [Paenibacillus thermoaerophilus]TMV10421.1 MarR family transcriptional regulator [Paenibacillus thermoaerophilus]